MHPAEDEKKKHKKLEKNIMEEKNRKLKNFAMHTLSLCNEQKKPFQHTSTILTTKINFGSSTLLRQKSCNFYTRN